MILDRYDLATYLQPYWQGNHVYQEAVLVLAQPDGTVADIDLLYPAEEIFSVRSSDLQREFVPGKDYALVQGKLRILPGSEIPVMDDKTYYPQEENELSKQRNGAPGYIFFSEGPLMHREQIAVSYRHNGEFAGPVPACKRHLLPRFLEKLENGGSLDLCVFGDSICVGGNSSGYVQAAPFAPRWSQMVVDQLQTQYPDLLVNFTNPSLGGKTSQWGAETARERVGFGPELCIIGFGMNDGTMRVCPEEYGRNIRTIMDAAREGNPQCEFVLLATSLPNKEVGSFWGYHPDYLPVLEAMEGPGVAVADMTTFHGYLLTKKRFFDLSGNNVNHPNDCLARAYAQVMWQTLVGF